MVNYITEYNNQIRTGRVIVSKKIAAVYQHLQDKLDSKTETDFTFDIDKANRPIRFIECFCRLENGKRFILEVWQKALLQALFGFVDEAGLRQYREIILIIGRKNGKSQLAAGIALYLLFADGEAAPQIYSAATKRDQAKLCWRAAKLMLKKSPDLKKRSKILVSEIECKYNDGFYKPLASDSDSLDGLNVHCSVIDELHQIKDKNLYDVIVDGMTARQQPLSVITTTAGTLRDGIYDLKYEQCENIVRGYDGLPMIGGTVLYTDERTLPIVYELDKETDLQQEANWYKANPGLGTIKNLQTLRDKVKRALIDTRLLNNLLCKDFNIRKNSVENYFELAEVNNTETFDINDLAGSYYIGGFDLSKTMDLTAAVALIVKEDKYYVISHCWLPEQTFEKYMLQKETIPYDSWVDQGYLTLCDGNRIDYHEITKWFVMLEEKYKLFMYKTGYDDWQAPYLVAEMKEYFGENNFQIVRQGKKTLSAPMIDSKALLQNKQINYNNNPLFRWNLLNVQADIDINGNVQPAKNRNSNAKIDAYAAFLNALVVYQGNIEDYKYL